MSVADTCFVTCKKTGLKTILNYVEEGWLGKTQNKVQGVVYKCDVEKDTTTKIKDVPEKDVIGRIEGAWHDKVYFYKSAPIERAAVSPATQGANHSWRLTSLGCGKDHAGRRKSSIPYTKDCSPG